MKKSVTSKVIMPYASLKDLLTELLACPGMEDQLDAWCEQPATEGKYLPIWHTNIWRMICNTDGDLFFGPCNDNELQIGVTCGLDWYYVFLLFMSASCFDIGSRPAVGNYCQVIRKVYYLWPWQICHVKPSTVCSIDLV
jgi:hypothetical protein